MRAAESMVVELGFEEDDDSFFFPCRVLLSVFILEPNLI